MALVVEVGLALCCCPEQLLVAEQKPSRIFIVNDYKSPRKLSALDALVSIERCSAFHIFDVGSDLMKWGEKKRIPRIENWVAVVFVR